MTPEDADDFISEYGLEAAKREIGMTAKKASEKVEGADTLAEGLEVVAQRWVKGATGFRETQALTPHAEATRLLAERDREIEGLKAERSEALTALSIIEAARVRAASRTFAAEADAAKLREALERIADPRNIHFAGDAQVVAAQALAQTKRRP